MAAGCSRAPPGATSRSPASDTAAWSPGRWIRRLPTGASADGLFAVGQVAHPQRAVPLTNSCPAGAVAAFPARPVSRRLGAATPRCRREPGGGVQRTRSQQHTGRSPDPTRRAVTSPHPPPAGPSGCPPPQVAQGQVHHRLLLPPFRYRYATDGLIPTSSAAPGTVVPAATSARTRARRRAARTCWGVRSSIRRWARHSDRDGPCHSRPSPRPRPVPHRSGGPATALRAPRAPRPQQGCSPNPPPRAHRRRPPGPGRGRGRSPGPAPRSRPAPWTERLPGHPGSGPAPASRPAASSPGPAGPRAAARPARPGPARSAPPASIRSAQPARSSTVEAFGAPTRPPGRGPGPVAVLGLGEHLQREAVDDPCPPLGPDRVPL